MPTRTGLGVIVGAILLTAMGIRARYDELVLVAVLAMLGVVVAAIVVRRPPTVVVSRGALPARAETGAEIRCRTTIVATSRRGVAAATLRDRIDSHDSGHAGGQAIGIEIPHGTSDQAATVSYVLRAHRRGVASVGPIAVRRADPLGLVAGEYLVPGTVGTVLVHPRVTPLHGQRLLQRSSINDAAKRGGSDPSSGFQSLRPYVSGDDTRSIHWPTTARTGALIVREYADPRRPSIAVVLMTERSDYRGDSFEDAAEIAASLCSHAFRHGIDVHLTTTDRRSPGRPQPIGDETEALDLLSRVRLTSPDESRPPAELVRLISRSTCAFVISGRSEHGLSRISDLADRVMHLTVAATADGLEHTIGSRGDDVVLPSAAALARWWSTAL